MAAQPADDVQPKSPEWLDAKQTGLLLDMPEDEVVKRALLLQGVGMNGSWYLRAEEAARIRSPAAAVVALGEVR
jgi:hypothetical protein